MDNPDFDGEDLNQVLNNLNWINTFLGNHKNVLNAILNLLPANHNSVKIVDVGCGGGDLILFLSKELMKRGVNANFTGVDFNPNILKYRNDLSNYNINYIVADVLSQDFEIPECDFLISSHFVYRFSNIELREFVLRSVKSVGVAVVFSELRRNNIAYLGFYLFGRLFFRNETTIKDGLLAIKRSFKINELREIFKSASYQVNILPKPWFRLMVVINTKEGLFEK